MCVELQYMGTILTSNLPVSYVRCGEISCSGLQFILYFFKNIGYGPFNSVIMFTNSDSIFSFTSS